MHFIFCDFYVNIKHLFFTEPTSEKFDCKSMVKGGLILFNLLDFTNTSITDDLILEDGIILLVSRFIISKYASDIRCFVVKRKILLLIEILTSVGLLVLSIVNKVVSHSSWYLHEIYQFGWALLHYYEYDWKMLIWDNSKTRLLIDSQNIPCI